MRLIVIVLLFLLPTFTFSQSLSNQRTKFLSTTQDTIIVDTLSIAPGTFRISYQGVNLDTSAYILDFINSRLIWKKKSETFILIKTDSVFVVYRTFSFLFSKDYTNKNKGIVSQASGTPYYYSPTSNEPELFKLSGLTRNGSISRGVSFGNNQDVFVNSSLNLQLAGKISDNVDILAAITDENIPIQPEGNTQQLQDFDKVFIQISNNKNKLIAGDFELKRPPGYFMNYYKKAQGAVFSSVVDIDSTKNKFYKVTAGIAVSKGKLTRNAISPTEGNQGPYKLTGNNGEIYIIVLSGTEKIYLDGILLTRGLQNDYTIDYNTAQLSFTTKRLITKDTRIVAEFEYSDKNYARSLLTMNNEYESSRLKMHLNLYSEQDSKNQSLNQQLDSAQKALLASIGDSIQNAFYPTADSVAFNSNVVLYQKKDTIASSGTYSIYLYSTKADSAYWQVNFSEVGIHRGDYIQDVNSANGRVYKWVEPISGISQGSFAPVALIVTPKQQQMLTAGADIQINSKNMLSIEGALSNYDINLFSQKDKKNDLGFAAKIIYNNLINLSSDTIKGWKLNNVINYEFTEKNFKALERFRNVEFDRDWNLGTNSIYNNEHISSVKSTLTKSDLLSVSYQFRTYEKGPEYRGIMNAESSTLTIKKIKLTSEASYLTTTGINLNTNFFRHYTELSRPFSFLTVGIKENTEQNKFYKNISDSILAGSYSFNELTAYANLSDSSKLKMSLQVKQRIDKQPFTNNFKDATKAQEVSLSTDYNAGINQTLRTTSTFRTLTIEDTILTKLEPVKTFLNRIDHYISLFKGLITATTYYELGTGQERKQDYYYLEVPAGQGVYAYLADYNNNGVKDLDEFAPAAFQSDAKYIRVFLLSNEYVITRTNQFSEVLNVSPAGKQSSIQGKEKFIFKFTDQLSIRFDKKTKGETLLSSLNPFALELNDTSLISNNSNLRNTIYYNRNSTVYGLDFTIQEVRNKTLLSNGFESRLNRLRVLNVRWNMNREFLSTFNYENGEKMNSSDFFSARNYRIFSNAAEPKITFQPGNEFRLSFSYRYSEKKNAIGTEGENAFLNKLNIETKYTTVNSGSITAKVSYVRVKFNAGEQSFLAYEMLEGFKIGENFIWNIGAQKMISNSMQLSLNYEGRKLQSAKVIHTGGVQFRAFF